LTAIADIQGTSDCSPLAGRTVRTRGVVIGSSRRGFFIQDPDGDVAAPASCGLFVFGRRRADTGALVEVEGRVVDFVRSDNDHPTTQLKAQDCEVITPDGPPIAPVWLTAAMLPADVRALARLLNSLEGMLVGIEAGATFLAGSNPFGDYVVAPPGTDAPLQTAGGGILIEPENPERWFPSFRIVDTAKTCRLHVGARLRAPITGPLNYRVGSYQIAVSTALAVEQADVAPTATALLPTSGTLTILTLNGFNLDAKIEARDKVLSARRDVDDDLGDRRFRGLARAIVQQAAAPDVVALQEIQDNDGAELSQVVDASRTYGTLIAAIQRVGGPRYHWADVPPEPDADGGQPGGNIRNGYLYNPARVRLVEGSLRRLGEDAPCYVGSRKPVVARFAPVDGGRAVTLINVHLASKRHQHTIFAPAQPGHDPRTPGRVRQAAVVREALLPLVAAAESYYVTGDFNDVEFSEPLRTLCGEESVNLVELLPATERYDYNHRGKLQVLMHGIVSRADAEAGAAEYEILHGNELLGVQPGTLSGKPSDHAYVIARLRVGTV
jgi:predicted extracellular nuclease